MENTYDIKGKFAVNVETFEKREEYTEELIAESLARHEDFDRSEWKQDNPERPAYHNEKHIEATLKGLDLLVENAEKGKDPLGLIENLEKWNDLKGYTGEQRLNIKQFRDIARQAFAEHDNGNIMDENGDYLSDYTSAGAEDRSKILFSKRTYARDDLSQFEKDQYENLGTHLIERTKYIHVLSDQDREIPFAEIVPIIDQLMNGPLTESEDYVDGLIEENAVEKPNMKASESGYFNFDSMRSTMLIPDKNKRKEFYEIVNQALPNDKKIELDDNDVPVQDAFMSKTEMSFKDLLTYRNKKKEIQNIINSNFGGLSSQTESQIEEIIAGNEELMQWYNFKKQ